MTNNKIDAVRSRLIIVSIFSLMLVFSNSFCLLELLDMINKNNCFYSSDDNVLILVIVNLSLISSFGMMFCYTITIYYEYRELAKTENDS